MGKGGKAGGMEEEILHRSLHLACAATCTQTAFRRLRDDGLEVQYLVPAAGIERMEDGERCSLARPLGPRLLSPPGPHCLQRVPWPASTQISDPLRLSTSYRRPHVLVWPSTPSDPAFDCSQLPGLPLPPSAPLKPFCSRSSLSSRLPRRCFSSQGLPQRLPRLVSPLGCGLSCRRCRCRFPQQKHRCRQ